LQVQAPNDGSFNLGPSRFYIRLKGGGIAEYPYNSVTLSPSDDHGPAGLLFKAPPEVLNLLALLVLLLALRVQKYKY
jgi:hypothetical protein